MKKILTILWPISIVLGMCACGFQKPVPDNPTTVAPTIATTPAETIHPLYIPEENRSFAPAGYVGDLLLNLNPGTICSEFPDGSGRIIELEVGGEYIVNGYSFLITDPEFMKEFALSTKYTCEDGRIFVEEVIPVAEFKELGAAVPIPWYLEEISLHMADKNGKDLGYVSTENRPFIGLITH